MAYAFLGIGLALLFAGSEALLRAGIGLSRGLGLPHLLTGLIVVSAASAAPEFAVALHALARHAPNMAAATVIGSNIVNVLLVIGLGALIAPLPTPPKIVFRDGFAFVLASAALVLVVLTGTFTRIDGFVFLAGLLLFIATSIVTDWRQRADVSEARAQCRTVSESGAFNLFWFVVGLAALYFGARCLIDGALAVGADLNISPAMMGLTAVALAASLPEFVIMIAMAWRGWTHVTVGHLLAASIFNILAVLGLVAALHPFAVSRDQILPYAGLLLGVSVFIMPLMLMSWRMSRFNGALLFVGFIAYAGLLLWKMGLFTLPLG